jgi:DNA-directed RNA polymerase subunit M/transcription elongation factor TFIIS
MPIDPKGTSPQAVPMTEEPETVNMKCKKCDSITANEMKYPGLGGARRMYRCTKCKHPWTINVGGDPGF